MHTVAYYTKRITRYWTASLQDRVRSCEFYAQARNELDTISLQAIESVEPLVNMTPSQRAVLHRVGSGIIIPEYLDCHCPGIPLAMERLKVDKVDQADIWGNGLIMATITGGYKTVMIPAMRESDVCRVFKADGTKRSAAEQVKWLREHGYQADVIIGARTKDLLFFEDEMRAVATNLYITTDDGSYVHKGVVTSVIDELVADGREYNHCVAIGPMIMMKFVCLTTQKYNIPTIVSMNPIMVDGTGMCGACRLSVGDEIKFACVDGPEFDGFKINWSEAMKRMQLYKTEEGRAKLRYEEGETHSGNCGN